MVQKTTLRLGPNSMKWGALDEATNVPAFQEQPKIELAENLLKVKGRREPEP